MPDTRMRCPRCSGEIEARLDLAYRWVYACLGACGTFWSLTDLRLARTPERTPDQ